MKPESPNLFNLNPKEFTEGISASDLMLQCSIVLGIYLFSFLLYRLIRARLDQNIKSSDAQDKESIGAHFFRISVQRLTPFLFPLAAIILLKLSNDWLGKMLDNPLILKVSLTVAALLIINTAISSLVQKNIVASLLRWTILPITFLHMIGILPFIIESLEAISFQAGNIKVTAFSVVRVIVFGSCLFWLGRASNTYGKKFIRTNPNIDIRTKEVATKLFEIGIFILFGLLLLQVMGINLTTLTVIGGAVGVGLGFGLQSIAANFISGLIILLDRSVTIGDFIEMEDGKSGIVREMSLRSTTLETYCGTDIVIPNEKFISEVFTNWTHKDKKQRYRVDFSVAYDSDIHALVPLIKDAVASHPQVIAGEEIPIEERPDCEISSFGDSGINMFVEFWMEGIDDGKNRVGGDLLLIILDTLRENGYVIPFPQRELRVLDSPVQIKRVD